MNIVCGLCGLFPLWPHGCLRVALGWLLGRARARARAARLRDTRRRTSRALAPFNSIDGMVGRMDYLRVVACNGTIARRRALFA